jgi:predicted nucleotidyltransferase component of viral defense system
VKQRLINLARKREEDFNRLLVRFVLERLLQRVAVSEYRDLFVLKGAMLFTVWRPGQPLHRATKDLDLLGFGSPDQDLLAERFRKILAAAPEEDDGVDFRSSPVKAEPIRENEEYGGVRLLLEARLGQARIPVQVDVGFGDSVFPTPKQERLPTLLDQVAPMLRIYSRETVVAEKLHAMLKLGLGNSRMKDYFDLRYLAENFSFEGPTLKKAVAFTLERRNFQLADVASPPVGLSAVFAQDASKQTQWTSFLQRSALAAASLPETVECLDAFLTPVLQAILAQDSMERMWAPGGPWSAEEVKV